MKRSKQLLVPFVTGCAALSTGPGLPARAQPPTAWVARYSGPDGFGTARRLAVDGAGNVYVTGNSSGPGTGADYGTVKYDAQGNRLWVARYNGPSSSQVLGDTATALAVDDAGNVYVTGYSFEDDTTYDYATVKYDTDGNEMWVARYNGPDNSTDTASALAVDAAGNVYVTGRSVRSGRLYDYATIKYDANGNQVWVARFAASSGNGAPNGATALAVDAAGNVYVIGQAFGRLVGESGYGYDYQYFVDFGCLVNSACSAGRLLAITASAQNKACDPKPTKYRYVTIKYDYNGPSSYADSASALALDARGNVYVTGQSTTGPGIGAGFITIHFFRQSLSLAS